MPSRTSSPDRRPEPRKTCRIQHLPPTSRNDPSSRSEPVAAPGTRAVLSLPRGAGLHPACTRPASLPGPGSRYEALRAEPSRESWADPAFPTSGADRRALCRCPWCGAWCGECRAGREVRDQVLLAPARSRSCRAPAPSATGAAAGGGVGFLYGSLTCRDEAGSFDRAPQKGAERASSP